MKPAFTAQSLVVGLCFLIGLAIAEQAVALVDPQLHTSKAPEDLTIEVLESRTETAGSMEMHWLRARVLTVHKSQSGLELGDEIEIHYDRDLKILEEIDKWFEEKSKEPGWAGESPAYPPTPPKVGQAVRAFLVRIDADPQTYKPAAKQYSFQ